MEIDLLITVFSFSKISWRANLIIGGEVVAIQAVDAGPADPAESVVQRLNVLEIPPRTEVRSRKSAETISRLHRVSQGVWPR